MSEKSLPSSLLKLTVKERIYVDGRLNGLTMKAAAAAAGYNTGAVTVIDRREHVQKAMLAAMSDLAEEIEFSRKEAHDMLMDAYMNAATAAEQIQAVKEMINLHGIAAPKQVEHTIEHKGSVSLEHMETEELIKLADMSDLVLDAEFEDITDDDKSNDANLLQKL